MPTPQQRFFRILLSVIFLAAFLRIVGYAIRFAADNLQMDFSAFYTAGESGNHGLSPYLNYLNAPSHIWDGVNLENHSRFLYPPLAANFFQLIAFLPFPIAKGLWTGIVLLCLAASLFISLRVLKQPLDAISLLILGIFVCLFYPLFLLLERGQVDTLTLLLWIGGIAWIVQRKRTFWAGILFALAALFKLHCIYILPFLVLRRQWKAIGGLAAGGVGLVLLSTLLNGPASTLDYIQKEIPALSNYQPAPTAETDPFRQIALEVIKGLPPGYTLKDGYRFRVFWLVFEQNATLLRTRISSPIISIYTKLVGRTPNDSVLSLIYFGFAFGLFAVWEASRHFRSQEADAYTEFIYWQIPLAIILLCAPLTWAMNAVWLLPAAIIFLAEIAHSGSSGTQAEASLWILSLCAGTLGLILAAIPDVQGFRFLVPYGGQLFRHKYVLGELMVLGGLFGLLAFHRSCVRK